MQCEECGKHLRLTHKRIEIDTLYKEYFCKNKHKTIVKLYSNCVEINGKVHYVDEVFDLSQAIRSEAKKRSNRDILQKITLEKKN